MKAGGTYAILFCIVVSIGCAATRLATVRSLAEERYKFFQGSEPVGAEWVVLKTTKNFGKALVIDRWMDAPRKVHITYTIDLNADWTARSIDVVNETDPIYSAVFSVAPTEAKDASTRGEKTNNSPAPRFSPAYFITDSPVTLMPILRLLALEVGGEATKNCVYHSGLSEHEKNVKLQIKRGADRGRRVCYQYQIDGGPWHELETDHRDLPFSDRAGDATMTKIDGPPAKQ